MDYLGGGGGGGGRAKGMLAPPLSNYWGPSSYVYVRYVLHAVQKKFGIVSFFFIFLAKLCEKVGFQ